MATTKAERTKKQQVNSGNSRVSTTPRVSTTRSASLPQPAPRGSTSHWTFLTNHSHVLILLQRNPSIVLREVAMQIGITERAVQRIIAELEEAGFIERERVGRQNRYRILTEKPLRHPIEQHRTIGNLLQLISNGNDATEGH